MRLFILSLFALTLAACSSSSQLRVSYDLAGANMPVTKMGQGRGQLTINEPKIVGALDNDRIAVRQNGAYTFLADGIYADRLPRLVQSRLVQSFENAGRLGAVGRPGERIASDYQLVLDIRTFHLNLEGGAEVRVEISVKLMNDKTGRIMAAEVFGGKIPASGETAKLTISAFEQALGGVMQNIVIWTQKKI